MNPPIPQTFYLHPDVVFIARELIGKLLLTRFEGKQTSGIITETEAYEGVTDSASHAFSGRRTLRTEIMYRIGGTAYVYLCYGIHSLFNIVTNQENIPHAILVRGIIPVDGKQYMLERTGKNNISNDFSNGPGKVSKVLGIHYSHTGFDLTKHHKRKNDQGIWLEDIGLSVNPEKIKITARIGVDYAGKDASLPYRFVYDTHFPT